MDKLKSKEEYKGNIKTLKETSKDKINEEFMTESQIEAIDFDQVKLDYSRKFNLKNIPKSNDALCKIFGEFYFIEFKNGKINSRDLWKKIYDSVFILSDINGVSLSEIKKKISYILVYNEEKINKEKANHKNPNRRISNSKSYGKILKTVTKMGEKEVDYFRVREFFENYCFKKVHTYSKEEFNKKFFS